MTRAKAASIVTLGVARDQATVEDGAPPSLERRGPSSDGPPDPDHTVKRIILAVAALLVAGALHPLPAGAVGCDAVTPPIWTNLSLPAPYLDNSQPQAAIQRRAPQSHGGHTIGLYVGTLKSAVQTGFRITTTAGRSCVIVAVVTVNLGVADRRIYLAHEWAPGSCPYRAILEHERKHQAADDRAMRDAAQAMRGNIARTVAAIGPLLVPRSQEKTAQQRLSDAIERTFQADATRLLIEDQRLQRAVDAGFEYARLTSSCSEFGRGYDPYAPLPPKGAAERPLLPPLR